MTPLMGVGVKFGPPSPPQLSRLEREGYYDKEQEYLEKIAGLASQIADVKSSNEGTYVHMAHTNTSDLY